MRNLFILGTTVFWLAVFSIWIAGREGEATIAAVPVAEESSSYTMEEVARHGTPENCWLAIEGKVYDLTDYLPEHPSNPDIILPWCGKEASEAYRTKTKGRSHSPSADKLLRSLQKGILKSGRPNFPEANLEHWPQPAVSAK